MNSVLLLLVAVTLSFANNGEPSSQKVKESTISWKGYKVTGSHEGLINLESGELVYNESGELTGGNFVLNMNSITCTDLEGEYKGKLEGHLKSEDFFAVESFPKATLDITKVSSRGVIGSYKVVADLTIKGITKPIKFNVTTEEKTLNAAITVDRSEYNVQYGSGSFFDQLGDNTIYDEFEIEIELSLE